MNRLCGGAGRTRNEHILQNTREKLQNILLLLGFKPLKRFTRGRSETGRRKILKICWHRRLEIKLRLSLCWWNTGLAPPRGNSNELAHLGEVQNILDELFHQRALDLVFLGEVNTASMAYLQENMRFRGFFQDHSVDALGNKFNFGVVARDPSLLPSERGSITSVFEMKKYKGAKRFELSLSDGATLCILVVHWPSRIMLPTESHQRLMIAQKLREVIDEAQAIDPDQKLIVLGDFNDEPFSDPVCRALCASRDRLMVRRDSRLLYNPFWRSLCDRRTHSKSETHSEPIGTYYFASGTVHRWHTLDQMLFSSSLVGDGPWHLCEDETGIWEDPAKLGVGPKMSKTIDHLPIFSAIERGPE